MVSNESKGTTPTESKTRNTQTMKTTKIIPERGIAFVDDATIERAITLVSIERARKELEK